MIDPPQTQSRGRSESRGESQPFRPPAPNRHGAGRRSRSVKRLLTLFAEVDDDGRPVYFLRPAALNSYRWARAAQAARAAGGAETAAPDADYLCAVRACLEERRLRDCGYTGDLEKIDDAAVAAAVMSGIVANPAFLDIVDDLLVRASCLCCYYTRSRCRAEDAEQQIRTLLGYFSQNSYEHSNVFYRVLAGFMRDVTPLEAEMITHHVVRGPRDALAETPTLPEARARKAIAFFRRRRNVCAAYTYHPQGSHLYSATQRSGWSEPGLLAAAGLAIGVYSTAEGRKLLRQLGKACKAAGLALTTRIATSDGYEFFCLRYRMRVYALEVHSTDAGAASPERRLEDFWACTARIR